MIEAIAADQRRAALFGAFLDDLSRPSPAQRWLEAAAEQLRGERDADGTRKANRDKALVRIMARDGSDCWFCGNPLGDDVTLEHLTPLALGGSWADHNLAAAHRGCNRAAGHLPRSEKEKMRAELRGKFDGRES